MLQAHAVYSGNQASNAPFNGMKDPLLSAFNKRCDDLAHSTPWAANAAETNKAYVQLRSEHRALVNAAIPDLVLIYRAKVALEAMEEAMRLQRRRRYSVSGSLEDA